MADNKEYHSYSEGGDGDHAKDTDKQKNGVKNYTRSSKNASKTAEKTTEHQPEGKRVRTNKKLGTMDSNPVPVEE